MLILFCALQHWANRVKLICELNYFQIYNIFQFFSVNNIITQFAPSYPQYCLNLFNILTWNMKHLKINKNHLTLLGGLKLCHYPTKVDALKLSWIKWLCNNGEANWKTLPKLFYKCDNLNLYFSANHKFLNNKNNIPPFYKDIHNLLWKTWAEYCTRYFGRALMAKQTHYDKQ